MTNTFIIIVTDFFKISTGHICIVGYVEPENHNFITSDYEAKILIDGAEERSLKILGQDIFARISNTVKNNKISIRTTDDLDDIIPYLGKKKIIVTGYLPDK